MRFLWEESVLKSTMKIGIFASQTIKKKEGKVYGHQEFLERDTQLFLGEDEKGRKMWSRFNTAL